MKNHSRIKIESKDGRYKAMETYKVNPNDSEDYVVYYQIFDNDKLVFQSDSEIEARDRYYEITGINCVVCEHTKKLIDYYYQSVLKQIEENNFRESETQMNLLTEQFHMFRKHRINYHEN